MGRIRERRMGVKWGKVVGERQIGALVDDTGSQGHELTVLAHFAVLKAYVEVLRAPSSGALRMTPRHATTL
jgi:hypothetical protein